MILESIKGIIGRTIKSIEKGEIAWCDDQIISDVLRITFEDGDVIHIRAKEEYDYEESHGGLELVKPEDGKWIAPSSAYESGWYGNDEREISPFEPIKE